MVNGAGIGFDRGPGPGGARPEVFAGALLAAAGAVDALAVLVRIGTDPYVAVTERGIVHYDITAWSWLHAAVALTATVAGLLVMTGRWWSRPLGIAVGVLLAASHALFLTYHPIRSLLVVGLALTALRVLLRRRPSGHPRPS